MLRGSVAAAGAALLPAAFTSPCAANHGMEAAGDSGIVTLPLLSHHHLAERRRLETRAAGDNGAGIGDSHFDRVPHPHRTKDKINNKGNSLRHLSQQQLGALYQGYGTHYVDVWVGYPAQRQTAVVDTGSSVTAFPCSECTDCGRHTDLPFDGTASESFRATHCPLTKDDDGCIFGKCDVNGMCIVEHNFGGDSADASGWTAYEASDIAYAGGPHDRPVDNGGKPVISPEVDELNPVHAPEFSFPLTFGCQTSVSGYFEKQLASGVMGLDRRAQSFWGQMRAAQAIKRAQFSLCFVRQPIASISGSTAGAVTLGGVDRRLHKTPMVFAKSVGEGSTASFKVRMRKAYLREGNDQSVMSSNKSKYHLLDISEERLNGEEMYNFDSGTTDTYLIKSLSDEFRRVWKDATGMEYTNDPISFNSDSDLLKFPTLILQMIPHNGGIGDEVRTGDPREVPGLAGNVDMSTPNDVMVAVPPRHYMQRNSKDKTYTSRIYLDRENALGNVLGANAMMGHDILFDMDGARIGFSESDCDYAGLVAASAKGSLGGEGGVASGSTAGGELSAASEDDEYSICSSTKCRGFFGLTLAVFFVCFFLFARRYVTKREGDGRVPVVRVGSNEYEMKASSRNIHAGGKGGAYSDGSDDYSDESHLPGGERVAYYDEPPPGYSDCHRSSGRHPGGRRDRSGSRESNRDRRHSRDRGERRSSSRDSAEGSRRSMRSAHSGRSHGSAGSGGSGGSRETKRSNRSHRSSRSHDTRESNRSDGSRESHHSHRSRESHRPSGGSSRKPEEGGGREHDNRHRRQSSGRGDRYQDEYDDIPMPPSIA